MCLRHAAIQRLPISVGGHRSRTLPGTRSKRFSFLPLDPGLPKDAHQQAATDVLGVRIGDPHQRPAVLSWLMLARRGGNRPIGKRYDKYPEVKAALSHPGGCLMGG